MLFILEAHGILHFRSKIATLILTAYVPNRLKREQITNQLFVEIEGFVFKIYLVIQTFLQLFAKDPLTFG